MDKVKVRIAPSPTGSFHVGNAQSALYNWLFARKNGGDFYVRIEDTDKIRSTKESENGIREALAWLDLMPNGDFVRQSDNLHKHKELLERLLSEGKAFYCHHSQEDLEAERQQQEARKEAPRHFCEHKNTDKNKIPGGIIRLAVNESSGRIISFDDQIRGRIEFQEALLGDFSIARAIEDPLYNFAVVADDAEMGITHVIRGEDHISNTPKQILIYEALGFKIPFFAHLPLVLGLDRSKLSKRHGGTGTLDYKQDYLPEALLNFLGGLSYTFSKEIITKEEMVNEFELGKIHKAGAVFNVEKLNWINSQYIKQLNNLTIKQLTNLPEMLDVAIPLITERLNKLSDINDFSYLWKEPSYDSELLNWKKFTKDEITNSLNETKRVIENWNGSDKDSLRLALDDLSKKLGDPSIPLGASRGLVYWPFRVALTGKEKSPDPVDVAAILTKETVLRRIDTAINKLP
ncbi:MAG: glutamate--tRNA ligase [Candidatus Yanofskybacteria bacterium RIFCSPLOWO2_01_FULL_42_49]|uniref:Glutamate--tRNA ligase n=1 Tax=Candidatus Yanofskybacteria bacterium RIFCSPLOWO2_01_FULL_42_49 TaxID=1802694 RepID=A0A1F8GEC2_9BACT|nr:MAG: glutamate--tRNA ligase [Candidatus Yanofskybacteria bacterium RIFCSPLOWO2_01_FULL_42_49]